MKHILYSGTFIILSFAPACAHDFQAQIFNGKNADMVKSFVCSSRTLPCLLLESLPSKAPFENTSIARAFTQFEAQCKFARDGVELPINSTGYALISSL